ncbi:MAG: hypothetical protein ACKOZY_10510, partial [Flavobacteriales bacterium]
MSSPKIAFPNQEGAVITQQDGEFKITFSRLEKSSMTLTISQENYQPLQLKIKRAPRKKALINDLIMFPLTLGLSTIDLFRADFYRVANRSQRSYVELEFTEAYMNAEFNRIKSLNDVQELNKYISTFTKSAHRDEAAVLLRKLEYTLAAESGNEIKVSDFVTKYPNTDESALAVQLLAKLKQTREAFETASLVNTMESYEQFLIEHPQAIQFVTACRRLVEVGVKQVLQTEDLTHAENLMNRSLLKYGNEIGFTVYQNKLDSIANHFS